MATAFPNPSGELVAVTLTGPAGGFETRAFVPDPLPADPYELLPDDPEFAARVSRIERAICLLDGRARGVMRDPDPLLAKMLLDEAYHASALEGARTTVERMLLFELTDGSAADFDQDDTGEAMNYRAALLQGHAALRAGHPMNLSLIRSLHARLLDGVRGSDESPGAFRSVHARIGSRLPPRFVPAPSWEVAGLMERFEGEIRSGAACRSPLVAALAMHYQFEAIHPFRDGNGRVGRMLLSLMLSEWSDGSVPWVMLSPFFEQAKGRYIDALLAVSTHGDWSQWLRLGADAVDYQVTITRLRCERIEQLIAHYRERVDQHGRLLTLVGELPGRLVFSITQVAERFGATYPTGKSDVQRLIDLGIIEPLEGQNHPKLFVAREVWDILYGDDQAFLRKSGADAQAQRLEDLMDGT